MKNLTKNELVAHIMTLNSIIRFIDERNCYEKVVEFFSITSELQDCSDQFEGFLPPIKGFKFLWYKSAKRKRSETNRMRTEAELRNFLQEIDKAGRDGHDRNRHNRTNPGEMVREDKLYLGEIQTKHGSLLNLFSIARAKECKDEDIQKIMRETIILFVKSFQNKFNTDWLVS